MSTILVVGNATLDIVNVVDGYPGEDDEVRAVDHYIQRGGNAANTAAVLAQLGHHCAWAGNVADEPDAEPILEDLVEAGVDTAYIDNRPQGKVPTSYITLNRANGSRTIVHYRDLPELSLEHFESIPLGNFDWVHFEGRNVPVLGPMLERAAALGVATSLEAEKPRAGLSPLLPRAGLLLFARAYAAAEGYDTPEEFLEAAARWAPDSDLVCAWGEYGAWYHPARGRAGHVPAHAPERVVDTLGAGDVFNAGMVDSMVRGRGLAAAVAAATRLAGRKCGQVGLRGLTAE